MKRFTTTKLLILLVLLCPLAGMVYAQPSPGGGTSNFLTGWSFWDTNAWHSDWDYAPKNYTNLTATTLGDGTALVLDSTNFACLRYYVIESSGTNNIQFNVGTILMWLAPASWASVSHGGIGPGQWGRLVECGTYTSDASYGWFSLYLDPGGTNIYFSVQTNNGNGATYLSAPISWTTNDWHHLALSYSSSNSSLYIDGTLVTNGAGVAYWPGSDVQTNGFCFGSDSSGVAQAHATFDDISTYSVPLDAATIQSIYDDGVIFFKLSPWVDITSAPYTNSSTPTFNIVTGPGFLTQGGTNATDCVLSTNIWLTNFVAKMGTNSTTTLTFLIGGGTDGVRYDVFANSVLALSSDTNHPWSWMGQGYHCVTNSLTITNQPNVAAFLVLGQPTDSDMDGLTDAYEFLVSKTNPYSKDSDGDGIPDGWLVLHRLPTQGTGVASQDPDRDALFNLQEYLYGTDPNVSEGFTIWISTPASNGLP